jgi:hypothetical protein
MGGGDLVLVLHEGRTLIRLDATTGSKRWSCPLSLEDMGRVPGALAFDERRLYSISRFASTVTLRAVSLSEGVPAWESTWTTGAEDSKWSISLVDGHVFAYPDRPGAGEDVGRDAIPIVVRRRETGALVQRLLFPADGRIAMAQAPQLGRLEREEPPGAVTLGLDHLGAVVVTPRGIWGLGVKESLGPATPIRDAAR